MLICHGWRLPYLIFLPILSSFSAFQPNRKCYWGLCMCKKTSVGVSCKMESGGVLGPSSHWLHGKGGKRSQDGSGGNACFALPLLPPPPPAKYPCFVVNEFVNERASFLRLPNSFLTFLRCQGFVCTRGTWTDSERRSRPRSLNLPQPMCKTPKASPFSGTSET